MSCVSGDRYRVRVHGVVAPWKLKLMRKGLSVDGIRYKPMIVKVEEKFEKKSSRAGRDGEKKGTNTWLHFTCTEGKNRQIRKICKHLQLDVSRLVRVGFGPYTLKGCDRGGLLKVDAKIAKTFLHKLEHPDEEEDEEEYKESSIPIAGVNEQETRRTRRKPLTRTEALER